MPKDPSSASSSVPPAPPPASPSTVSNEPATAEAGSLGFAPTFASPVAKPAGPKPWKLPDAGESLEDYELRQVLGEGSFGRVFLARQISLDRQVALKVTANRGSEAQTLASLEHDHIVQVFLETVLPQQNLRLLCMQFVAGTTLDKVIHALQKKPRWQWSGLAVLEAIDQLNTHPAIFHPAALRDRELLGDADFVQAVCWLGARMAEALAYAHSQGVLHRDIKPANILINSYGRPMLADFNLAFSTAKVADMAAGMFGGTLAYMAPEHLDAFNPEEDTAPEAVSELADIYSLGVLLFEFLTGERPFSSAVEQADISKALRVMAIERREGAPSPLRIDPDLPAYVDRVIRRCLDPDPARRYQSAEELARALDGCRDLRRIEREMPPAGRLVRAVQRRPLTFFLAFALVPHLFGSAVNISYNALEIVGSLTAGQQRAFDTLVLVYNLITYPVCIWLVIRIVRPIFRARRALRRGVLPDIPPLDEARQKVLSLPWWVVVLSCIGWLPGGLLFPVFTSLLAEPLSLEVSIHFLISFTLSGVIALTYCYFGVQFVAIRVLYPELWLDGQRVREVMAEELRDAGTRSWFFQLLAGVIPLAAAMLMIGIGLHLTSFLSFRVLTTLLILAGMAGFGLAVLAREYLTYTLGVLRGAEHRRRTL
jgi:serine/threonine protein kinase